MPLAFASSGACRVMLLIAMVAAANSSPSCSPMTLKLSEEFALYLKIAAWGYAGFGLLIVANGILNAVDKASLRAHPIRAARVFLVMLPFALGCWSAAGAARRSIQQSLPPICFGGLTGLAILIYWVSGPKSALTAQNRSQARAGSASLTISVHRDTQLANRGTRVMDDLLADFVAETREMLEASEGEIVSPGKPTRLIVRVSIPFSAFVHTVKGNCGFFDFPRLAES